MTLCGFKLLDEAEQIETVWERGVMIADRIESEYNLVLYQIDGFYVEAWYHRELNHIDKFISFSSMNRLEPYLKKINF